MQGIERAEACFGKDLIGPEAMAALGREMGIGSPRRVPEFPCSFIERADREPGAFLAILGPPAMADDAPVTLLALRNRFGIDSGVSEPCFYNQDWYLREAFASRPLEPRWHLLRKGVLDATRGRSPEDLMSAAGGRPRLPSAILCAYAFFAHWFLAGGERLWEVDYVWCEDTDHQGDRIYVGRYTDPAFVQKPGFSIHRHLHIRENYGVSEFFG